MTASYTFDKKTLYQGLSWGFKKFLSLWKFVKAFYGDSFENYYSEETIERTDEALEKAAKDNGQKVWAGETTTTLFKGKG